MEIWFVFALQPTVSEIQGDFHNLHIPGILLKFQKLHIYVYRPSIWWAFEDLNIKLNKLLVVNEIASFNPVSA